MRSSGRGFVPHETLATLPRGPRFAFLFSLLFQRSKRAKIRREKIGFVFQHFNLLPRMTILDNIALPLAYSGSNQSRRLKLASDMLERLDLRKKEYYLPHQLSGGQVQRAAIARALINKPSIVVADEPTGNLDDEIGLRLMGLFDQLNRMGTTVLIASHNNALMEKFSHHPKLILDTGQVRLLRPHPDLKNKLRGIH